MCPALMGTFDYPPPFGNVKMISAILDQPKAEIFQVLSFCTTYFIDSWTLPSPSAMMEGTGNHGMDMHLSVTKVAYSIVQQASFDPDSTSAHELDPIF
jgi:hypothetical protein